MPVTTLMLSLAVGCGAKTGLAAPCLIALLRDRPALVVINGDADTASRSELDGRSFYDEQPRIIDAVLRDLDDISLIGAVLNPEPGYQRPREGDLCTPAVPISLTVPLTLNGRAAVLRAIATTRGGSIREPTNIGPAFRQAVDALNAIADPTRRFVLITQSTSACNAGSSNLGDIERVSRAEARTLVVVMSDHTDYYGWSWIRPPANALAVAGRLAIRTGEEAAYWPTETAAIIETFRREVVVPFYCVLRPEPAIHAVEGLSLRTSTGEALTHDGSEPAWTLNPDGRVQVRGSACDEAVRTRAALRLVSRGDAC